MQQDDQIFNAEEVLDERAKDGVNEYRVKWKGWNIRDSTWEPLQNLLDPRLMTNFREKQNSKKGTEIQPVETVQEERTHEIPPVKIVHEEASIILEDSSLVPKEIIGPNKFWQQKHMLELFNSAYIGKITVDSLTRTINERKDLIQLHYKDYVKRKDQIQKLKEKDTFSLPRIKQKCPYKCASCDRNYLNKETLKNHLMSHIRNIKLFKRNKYATDRDHLAAEQLKILNLKAVVSESRMSSGGVVFQTPPSFASIQGSKKSSSCSMSSSSSSGGSINSPSHRHRRQPQAGVGASMGPMHLSSICQDTLFLRPGSLHRVKTPNGSDQELSSTSGGSNPGSEWTGGLVSGMSGHTPLMEHPQNPPIDRTTQGEDVKPVGKRGSGEGSEDEEFQFGEAISSEETQGSYAGPTEDGTGEQFAKNYV